MSKRKRDISYIKNEPKFIRELKESIGFKEGPTIETKREILPQDDDIEDKPDEQPTVVVLEPGHLTLEEADEFMKQKQEEEDNKPADLSKKITFRSKKLKSTQSTNKNKEKIEVKHKKPVLSFNVDDDEDDGTS